MSRAQSGSLVKIFISLSRMSHFDPGIVAEISTGNMNLSRALRGPVALAILAARYLPSQSNAWARPRPRPGRPTQALTSLLSWRGVSLRRRRRHGRHIPIFDCYLRAPTGTLARGYNPYSALRHRRSRQDDN